MRGRAKQQTTLFSLRTPGERVPKDHPLRKVKTLADEVLRELSPVFDEMYAGSGRSSVPPERLLKATLLVAVRLEAATGTAERESALDMLGSLGGSSRITLGADKGYDTKDFVRECRFLNVTPHVAQKKYSAIDARTTAPPGYAVSQRVRKRIEEVWGWAKTVAGFRKSRFIGRAKTELAAYFVAAAYNLLRIAKLRTA